MCGGEGVIGVCVWLGAPIMHGMSGLNLAWQPHGICWHEHLKSQSGIVGTRILLLIFLALDNVRNHVFFIGLECLGNEVYRFVVTCNS